LALANLNNPTIAHYDFAFVNPWTKRMTVLTFKTIITIEDGVKEAHPEFAANNYTAKYNYWELRIYRTWNCR
jgi:hypothetical protein